MKECRRYIDEHLNEKLKPEDLAKQFGYSYASFRRIFWEIGGYTVYEYIRLRRVQTAARCIRHGGDLAEATKKGCFRTYAGFYKAFLDVYGMNPSEYLRTRGTDLMTEPEIVSREAFYIVGYCLPGEKGLSLEDRAAYWIAQEFPSVSEREYARIGGGPEMISVWIENKKTAAYITGPGVKQVQYIPKPMKRYLFFCQLPRSFRAVPRVWLSIPGVPFRRIYETPSTAPPNLHRPSGIPPAFNRFERRTSRSVE